MPFHNYSTVGEAALEYRITIRSEDFLQPVPLAVSEQLRADLRFAHDHVSFDISEVAVCENLIYPVLKEVWKHHTDALSVWSHAPLHFDSSLSGTPDYLVAKRSPLGHVVMDKPYVVVIEAKKDDYARGWGQCLAAMVAAQRLNSGAGFPIYGITTNGRFWEFGRLDHAILTRNNRPYILDDLDTLCGAVNYVFDQSRKLIADPSQAA